MKPLPKIFGYLAFGASLVATYYAQTGHAPPAYVNNILIFISLLSHSITGDGKMTPFTPDK